jgi:hypothetical protein
MISVNGEGKVLIMRYLRLIIFILTIGMAPTLVSAYGLISESESTMAFSAMMSAGNTAAKVKQITKVPSVGVLSLNVPHLFGGTSFAEYQISASKNAGGIKRLRSALSANPVTRSALEQHGIPINLIAGVRVSSNGSLRVYVLH